MSKHARPDGVETTLNWTDILKLGMPFKVPGCDWISFESIRECLHKGNLEDTSIPQHKNSNHAARIAHLVQKLYNGDQLDPLLINVGKRVSIWDGSHRFRAYQYLHRTDNMPVVIIGPNKDKLLFAKKPIQEQVDILRRKEEKRIRRKERERKQRIKGK